MFTGIVEEIGTVARIQHGQHSAVLTIQAETVLEGTKLGDSIAVNGICLTVTSLTPRGFSADVMHETLNRSALSGLKQGSRVNLERAMAANGRFGGHIVSGHVDGVGSILGIRRDDTAIWYTVGAQPPVLRYIVEKGSIAIDGISLTVARVDSRSFSISAIPHTVAQTVLKDRKEGDMVNLETDIIGKYVEKLMGPTEEQPQKQTITKEFLSRYGF
jgi:riboflavin synthase